MITTTNSKILTKIIRFSQIKKRLKALNDEEHEIKTEIKAIMKDLDTKVLVAGDYAAVITDRMRTDLDKELLRDLFGDQLKNAERQVVYQIFEVKKA